MTIPNWVIKEIELALTKNYYGAITVNIEDGQATHVRPGRTIKKPKRGQPCRHPGCLSHVTHPCEWCGRVAGQ